MPFSVCESGRFRTAPIRSPDGLRARWRPVRPDTGSSDRGPARQKAMLSGKRAATGSEGASASEGSGRTGFRPGSCEPGMDPAFRRMTMSGGTEASAEDPAGRDDRGFGLCNRQGKEEGLTFRIRRAANRQGFGPVGEPPGTPGGLRPRRTPEDAGPGFALVTAPRNRPSRTARFGGTANEGTVGAGSDAGPHYCLGVG